MEQKLLWEKKPSGSHQNCLYLGWPIKIVNQKQNHIPGGIVEISATIKDLEEDEEVVILPHPPSSCLLGLAEDRWVLDNDSGLS